MCRTLVLQSAGLVRLDRSAGRISSGPQAFGTRAHRYFERLNNRLSNRVSGKYKVSTEQFRTRRGGITPRRRKGTIGADVIVESADTPGVLRNFDLKTYTTVQRPISTRRQNGFLRRFRRIAEEIFVRQ